MLEVIISLLRISLGWRGSGGLREGGWGSDPHRLSIFPLRRRGEGAPGEPRTGLAPGRAAPSACGSDPGGGNPLSCVPRGSLAPQLLHHPLPRETEPARTPSSRGCTPHEGHRCTPHPGMQVHTPPGMQVQQPLPSTPYTGRGRSPPAQGHQETHGDRHCLCPISAPTWGGAAAAPTQRASPSPAAPEPAFAYGGDILVPHCQQDGAFPGLPQHQNSTERTSRGTPPGKEQYPCMCPCRAEHPLTASILR